MKSAVWLLQSPEKSPVGHGLLKIISEPKNAKDRKPRIFKVENIYENDQKNVSKYLPDEFVVEATPPTFDNSNKRRFAHQLPPLGFTERKSTDRYVRMNAKRKSLADEKPLSTNNLYNKW